MDHVCRAIRVCLIVFAAIVLAAPGWAADIVGWQAGPSGLVLTPLVPFEFGSLTVSAPDGVSFKQELKPGATITFTPFSRPGYRPPEGTYVWEVTLGSPSAVNPKLHAAARAGRDGSGDLEVEAMHRVALSRATQTQSGAFTVQHGTIVPSNMVESGGKAASSRNGREANPFKQADWLHDNPSIGPVDQVIPDDLIVQGSACV